MGYEVWTLIIWLAGTEPIVLRDYHIEARCVEVCDDWKAIEKDRIGGVTDCICLKTLRVK